MYLFNRILHLLVVKWQLTLKEACFVRRKNMDYCKFNGLDFLGWNKVRNSNNGT